MATEANTGPLKDALRDYDKATRERLAGSGSKKAVEQASKAVIDAL